MSYREIEGDLISLANKGEFDVITHGCNCFCKMKSGIAPKIAKEFSCDTFKLENSKYIGEISKLGNIDYRKFYKEKEHYGGRWVVYPDELEFIEKNKELYVVNSYTQYKYGKNHIDGTEKPLDYDALTLCLRKINHKFSGLNIGLPKIGCGLAGGDWSIVKKIIKKELKNMDVNVVIYN